MKISLLLSFLILVIPATAQHAVRPDFPNWKSSGVKFEHFTKKEWDASNYAKSEDMKTWQDRRYGMFIHFGVTSMPENGDLSWGTVEPRLPDGKGTMSNGEKRTEAWTRWPAQMKLEKFNAKEWVEIARKAGFQYIVVTTKHHEGFHMWDTAFSDFKITNTPFGRDYLKELTDACHQAGMPVGFYFAQREWYHPDYQPVDPAKVTMAGSHQWKLKPGETSPLGPRHAKYLEYEKNVIRELCTKYGKIDIWWWDATSWGTMFTAEMWDSENMTRMIRKLQPGIVINNRASLPGDFDTPEQHLGDFQEHRPWETCIPISQRWCYSGQPARTFDQLIHLLAGAATANGNLLASWGPHWDGAFDEAQKQRLYEVGDWLKANGESIYGTRGGPWKPATWGGSTRKGNTAYLHLFSRPADELVLPAIPGRQVVSARMLVGGEAVKFRQSAGEIVLSIPGAGVIKGDLVVALVMNDSLDALPSISSSGSASTFATDATTYGKVISRQAKVKTSSNSNEMPALVIDLGRPLNATGMIIRNTGNGPKRISTLRASVSLDGTTWSEIWKTEVAENTWEVPITSFVAGADVPGRQVRYIRLETKPTHLLLKQVEVYGKP